MSVTTTVGILESRNRSTTITTSNLRHVCCVENYESSDIRTYQKTLEEILKENVSHLFQEETEDDYLLLTVIPWKLVLENHDEKCQQDCFSCSSSSSSSSSSSLLTVILKLLCNPVIIPYASWGCLWIVFIQVFQKKPLKSRWRPSDILLLRYMEYMARKIPAMLLRSHLNQYQQKKLRSMLQQIMTSQSTTSFNDLHSVNLNQWKKYFRGLTELSQRLADPWFFSIYLSLSLNISQTLDDVNKMMTLDKSMPSAPLDDVTMCLACQKQIRPLEMHSHYKRGFSTLQILDDFEGDLEKSARKMPVRRHVPDQCCCPMSCRKLFSKDIQNNSQLTFHLFLLRSYVYDVIYQTFKSILNQTSKRP
jgi:hypothetical protein